MNARVFLVVAVAVILLFKCRDSWSFSAAPSRWAGPSRRRAGRSSPWTSCRNLSPPSWSWDYTTFPGHFDMVWPSPVCTEYSRALTTRPRRLLEGDALVLSALEIIAHFDPLMWVIENPATGLLKTRPFMERLPWVDVLQVRNSVQEADAAVDQHALEAEAKPVQAEAWQDGRHLRAAQRGPRLMEGQYERVSQSRELLYSVPAALCEEIARAATEELAERLSIPD